MGDFRVRTIKDSPDRALMLRHIIDDIHALEVMLADNKFKSSHPKIGAEQEICIVDKQFRPAKTNLQILERINDPNYTNELALFNLEINLKPRQLQGSCLSQLEKELLSFLKKGQKAAAHFDNHLIITGILPTLKFRHLQFEYITPIPRYHALSKVFYELRGSEFEIYIQGLDDLNLSLSSMLFEACNTSFQMHLEIDPANFVDKYNWAQMIAGPVLAIGANSPLLFGNELWAETRIAVFKQSIDARSSTNQMRKKTPRVFFGEDWLRTSPVDLFKEEVARFPLILTSDNLEWSTEELKAGKIPELRAAKIHNGTTYTWNRICYGHSQHGPHFRIECRYLPAGPSPLDEVANLAFWVGLMQGQPESLQSFWKKTDFKTAKTNFLKAARYGNQVTFDWFGEQLTAQQLLGEKLLPMAREGLKKFKVNQADIDRYLSVIEHRIERQTNGADWQIRNFRKLQTRMSPALALREMTSQMITFQQKNLPVHKWNEVDDSSLNSLPKYVDPPLIEEIMTTDFMSVSEDDSLLYASVLFQWYSTAYLPVENKNGEVIGLLLEERLQDFLERKGIHTGYVKEVMIHPVPTLSPDQTVTAAQQLMHKEKIKMLPIISIEKKLVGIITLDELESHLNRQKHH